MTEAWMHRCVEKTSGLVHLATISCPGRRELPSSEYTLHRNKQSLVLTCLWCMRNWWPS